jgi:putative hydrolase of the HAD superfamily
MKRPVLIFDFGNVVAYFDHARACARLGRQLGLSGEELLARLRALGLGPVVREYESGRMASEEFSTAFCRIAGLERISHAEFAAAWCDIFWANEPMAALLASLKARGHTLILGSNTNAMHADHYRIQFAATLAHFDHLVFSYEVGATKPQAAFYDACARAGGRLPAECIFIDDMPENVAGAQAAGMTGLLYRDLQALLKDLRGVGVV